MSKTTPDTQPVLLAPVPHGNDLIFFCIRFKAEFTWNYARMNPMRSVEITSLQIYTESRHTFFLDSWPFCSLDT